MTAINGGDVTAGTIVLYVAYLQRFYFPILILTNFYNQLQSGLAAAERIFSLMDRDQCWPTRASNAPAGCCSTDFLLGLRFAPQWSMEVRIQRAPLMKHLWEQARYAASAGPSVTKMHRMPFCLPS